MTSLHYADSNYPFNGALQWLYGDVRAAVCGSLCRLELQTDSADKNGRCAFALRSAANIAYQKPTRTPTGWLRSDIKATIAHRPTPSAKNFERHS